MAITVCKNWGKARGCQYLAEARSSLCAACGAAARASARAIEDAGRRSAAKRGYDREWDALARLVRKAQPTCAAAGCGRATKLVDHLVPLAVAPELRLDPANLWGLCRGHHRMKTAIEIKLGLVREGEGGRAGTGVRLEDLARLTVTIADCGLRIVDCGASERGDLVLVRREWWARVLELGIAAVCGVWREKTNHELHGLHE